MSCYKRQWTIVSLTTNGLKVKDSLAAVERGETVSNDEVLAWLDKRERS